MRDVIAAGCFDHAASAPALNGNSVSTSLTLIIAIFAIMVIFSILVLIPLLMVVVVVVVVVGGILTMPGANLAGIWRCGAGTWGRSI